MPKRPKDETRENVKEQFWGLELLKSADFVQMLGRIHRIASVRPDAVEELAVAWTANNVPAEDIARILEIAREAFDDADKARIWLQEPNIQTGNRPPISLIGTPEGYAAVESVLRQIQYAVFG
jgi:hypothetical protein